MFLQTWLRPLRSYLKQNPRRPHRTHGLRFELLEDRTLPSTFLVTDTGDNAGVNPAVGAGTGTLRQAIVDANASPGPNVIAFAIPAADANTTTGAFTIQPLSALPAINSAFANAPLLLDGTTQSGYAGTPLIELNGALAGVADGLDCTGGFDTIQGLDINSFSGDGIVLNSNNNTVSSCFIGTDVTGTQALGNQHDGIRVLGSGNTIGGTAIGQGNVISGNGFPSANSANLHAGVDLFGTGNSVEGNLIGLAFGGNSALANAESGVWIHNDSNVIGGSDPAAGNIISGNLSSGILIQPSGSSSVQNVLIQGNYIGTNAAGSAAVGNAGGIYVAVAGQVINSTISGNLISGNTYDGITYLAASSVGTAIAGNRIGADSTGLHALGNGATGIVLEGSGLLVGGTTAGAGNIISANGLGGILIITNSQPLSNDTVEGNLIGTDANGQATLGNTGDGVQISNGDGANAHDNLIGGAAAGVGNIIAGNTGNGVSVFGPGAFNNRIQDNSIFANSGLGIDLGDDGVSTNAHNDAANHNGPNELMNFPVITGANSSPTDTNVSGTLDTNTVGGPYPNGTTITLDFYASTAPDPTGYGQGQTWLGYRTLTVDGTGSMSFTFTGLAALPAGEGYVTATATDGAGNTSEFSLAFAATILAKSTTTTLNAPAVTYGGGGLVTVTVAANDPLGGTPAGTVTLSVDNGTALTGTLSNGSVTLYVGVLPAGTHTLTASYPAQGIYTSSSASGTFIVNRQPTTTFLSMQSSRATLVPSPFSDPRALAFDSSGNLYVANPFRATVSKVSPNGTVSIFASFGNFAGYVSALACGSYGYLYVATFDEFGDASVFSVAPDGYINTVVTFPRQPDSFNSNYVSALAFDSSGNLYVSNVGTGTVDKVSGGGVSSFGPYFGEVDALAFDSGDNLFVAGSNQVKKITPGGVVTTFVSAGLSYPSALAFDSSGNLYVANEANNTVSKVTPSGVVSTFVSSGLSGPDALAIDSSGNLYIANADNSTLTKVTLAGVANTLVLPGLVTPVALTFGSGGNLYVANGDSTLSKVTPNGVVSTFVSSGLSRPSALAIDSNGNFYIANSGNNTVSEVSPGGLVSTFVSSGLSGPDALAFDSSGNLYVANAGNNSVSEVTPGGVVSTFVSSGLSDPVALAFDSSGNLYVANVPTLSSGTISKVTPSGVVSTFFSSGGFVPAALAVDSAGNLYIADTYVSSVIVATPNGVVSTLIDTALYSLDAIETDLYPLDALAFDSSGNLYVASESEIDRVIVPVFGQAITFSLNIYPAGAGPAYPTGTVTLVSGSTTLGSATLDSIGGRVTVTIAGTTLPAGGDIITASYSGDGNYSPSTTTIVQPLARAATATTVSASAGSMGGAVGELDRYRGGHVGLWWIAFRHGELLRR